MCSTRYFSKIYTNPTKFKLLWGYDLSLLIKRKQWKIFEHSMTLLSKSMRLANNRKRPYISLTMMENDLEVLNNWFIRLEILHMLLDSAEVQALGEEDNIDQNLYIHNPRPFFQYVLDWPNIVEHLDYFTTPFHNEYSVEHAEGFYQVFFLEPDLFLQDKRRKQPVSFQNIDFSVKY